MSNTNFDYRAKITPRDILEEISQFAEIIVNEYLRRKKLGSRLIGAN